MSGKKVCQLIYSVGGYVYQEVIEN